VLLAPDQRSPQLIAPGPGPLSAGLVFRVGQADETLAWSGITHMVEHLALFRHGCDLQSFAVRF
jgi:hypothetical protein